MIRVTAQGIGTLTILAFLFLFAVLIASSAHAQPVWTQIETTGEGPPARFSAALAPAPEGWGGGVLLYGGSADPERTAALGDVWLWNERGWTPRRETAPGPRYGHVMARLEDGSVLLYGGARDGRLLGDTWVLEAGGWRLDPRPGPPARAFAALAFVPELGGAVLFGGGGDRFAGGLAGDTWLYRSKDGWTRIEIPGPPARWRHAMAYSAYVGHDVVGLILFGGDGSTSGGAPLNDSWRLYLDGDRAVWEPVAGLHRSPPARFGHAMAEFHYQHLDKHVAMIFGGRTGPAHDRRPVPAPISQHWEFNTWSRLQRPAEPPPRSDACLAWDPEGGRQVLFGGLDPEGVPLGDTWTLADR